MENLNFGTFSGVSKVAISTEIKTALRLDGGQGLCTLDSVVKAPVVDETTGEVVSNKIQLRFLGIEGGGCTDTLTTKSASMWQVGLERIKYLFNAISVAFPASCANPTIHPNVNNMESEIFKVAHSALKAYETATSQPISPELVQKDAQGNIIITAKGAFAEIFGDSGLMPKYADLDSVNRERISHQRTQQALKDDAGALEQENARYNEFLDAQPVLPCLINPSALEDVFNALNSIEKDASVFIKARDWNSKVKTYQPAK